MAPTAAGAAGQPPFRFSSSETLTLAPGTLKQGASADLLNETTRRHNVDIRLSGFAFRDEDGHAVGVAKVITVPRHVLIAAAGAKRIMLEGTKGAAELKPGTYDGWLVASERKSGTVARRAISFAVAAPSATSEPKPAVAKINLRGTRWLPGFESTIELRDPVVPLDQSVKPNATLEQLGLAKGEVLGFLTGEADGVAAIEVGDKTKELADGKTAGVLLDSASEPGVGAYGGTIGFPTADPADGKVDVGLTVTDFVFWPLLAIALGILGALGGRRWVQVRREVWKLRSDLGQAGVDFRERQMQFEEDTAGHSFGYALDFAEGYKAADARIDGVKENSHLNLDKDSYAAALEAVAGLQQAVEGWGQFGAELLALDRALADVRKKAGVEGPPKTDSETAAVVPVLVEESEKLLHGGELQISDLEPARGNVAAAAALADTWVELVDQLGRYEAVVKALEAHTDRMTPEQQRRLRSAGEALQGARWELWTQVETADDLANLNTRQDLERAEELFSGLTGHLPVTQRLAADERQALADAAASRGGTAAALDIPQAMKESVKAPVPDYAGDAKAARNHLKRWDWALAVGAFALAVLTALNSIYFGKNFGTLNDYLTAFLWGATTQGALEALTAALGRLGAVLRPS